MAGPDQQDLFLKDETPEDLVVINDRAAIRTQDGCRVVLVVGIPLAHYAVGDRMAEAYAMVSLVEQGWADQVQVARAFQVATRTVRRHQRRFEEGGLVALGRPGGYPRGRPRLPRAQAQLVNRLKARGASNCKIASVLGVSEKAVRKLLPRLGWGRSPAEQTALALPEPVPAPEPTAPTAPALSELTSDPNLSASAAPSLENAVQQSAAASDPNLSASQTTTEEDQPLVLSQDADPADRSGDRLLACLGVLEDAAPLFRDGQKVAGAGVLLAMPALLQSGVLEIARQVYGSIGPAFYGLRTTVVALLLLALLRIKRPEALKENSPSELGRLLGLDRAPEVKTLRRKLAKLASLNRAAEFGRQLAKRRVEARGAALGFLYVDGHVRVYHGKRTLPKAHVARMRISMPATTDYWVNDQMGDPLLVVTTEANPGLVKMLPPILDEVRGLVGGRRVTIVFDRGGWSPKLFAKLIAQGFDVLTYRKGRSRRVSARAFRKHTATIDGHKVSYTLADQGVRLLGGKLQLRQVTRLQDDHQTPIITSRRDLPAVEIAYRMFERWRQENFFKYLREEYALDALVDYDTEPADAARDVPNPRWNEIDAKLRKARLQVAELAAYYGLEAFTNVESQRRTMRGFKIANAKLAAPLLEAFRRCARLEAQRAKIPRRIPVGKITDGVVIKLATERKHLTNLFKMVAYQAESDLVRLVMPHYQRADDEGRTLVQNALGAAGDIKVGADEIRVYLEPLNSPHRARALAALCDQINQTETTFPGSALRLHFEVKPPPPTSMAFPGGRAEQAQPDTSGGG
jgi:transposase